MLRDWTCKDCSTVQIAGQRPLAVSRGEKLPMAAGHPAGTSMCNMDECLQGLMTKSEAEGSQGQSIHRYTCSPHKDYCLYDAEADKKVMCHGKTLATAGLAIKAAVLDLRDNELPTDQENEIWITVRCCSFRTE